MIRAWIRGRCHRQELMTVAAVGLSLVIERTTRQRKAKGQRPTFVGVGFALALTLQGVGVGRLRLSLQ